MNDQSEMETGASRVASGANVWWGGRFVRFLLEQVPESLVLPDQESKALFAAEDQRLTIRSLTLLCLLAVILVLGTTVLDAIVYPE
ncbi:hypothetical protein N8525_05180, partial [Verrucomicrobiales bacterium]|nr:hypothetical protein [Verrucomicrobiales bacterium]